MPITIDDKQLTAGLAEMVRRIYEGAEQGLSNIAPVIENAMQTDPAHGDMSGAAHASSVVAGVGGQQNTQGELDFAYAVAADRLNGFTGHQGRAERVDAPTVAPTERGLVLARPVDYAADLEQSPKAVIGPVLQQYATAATQSAADGIRDRLR